MGCDSCGTSKTGGKPGGCKSNGGCSTGGCNRLNVHDWLMNLPVSDIDSACKVMEVSFKQGSRKEFFRNATLQHFDKGDLVTVEGVMGYDVGEVSLTGELVRLQLKKKGVSEFSPEMKKVLRPSSEKDIQSYQHHKAREREGLMKSRTLIRQLNLQMKLSELEIQADGKKATFFYTADDRVDFRELIKMLASEFKVKVEMRQIGIRQEAGKVGGIGSCGRELCCSTWLTDFKSVTTTAARYQNLSINQTKLSGQCGRLKCCLNYELDTYLDALQHFPDNAEVLETTKGRAFLVKKDIFKNLVWYTMQDSTKHYPLTIKRVKEIQQLNSRGQRPDELEHVELTNTKERETEHAFVDVVGQITLQNLERTSRRHRDKNQQQNKPRRDNRPPNPRDNNPNRPPQRSNQPPRDQKDQRNQGNPGNQRNQGSQRNPRDQRDPRDQRPPRESRGPGNTPPDNTGK